MESIDLKPRYSSEEVTGRCIKCLAEEKLFACMRELLNEEKDTVELRKRYELLYSFLKSPELQKLCDETEKYMSDGKEVSVRIFLESGKPKYEIKFNEQDGRDTLNENCSSNR